ncbi:hypothetical protein ILYODFUR_012204 [Ilyodon furcidens]|uniref:Uncharacterized protein n=1 Tax=Ilyodon furcidens TaxID=33524 RepID=A0ABV0TV61_9TELE
MFCWLKEFLCVEVYSKISRRGGREIERRWTAADGCYTKVFQTYHMEKKVAYMCQGSFALQNGYLKTGS